TLADHSQKWHDGSNSRKVSNGSSDGIAAIANKLDNLGHDMKKRKENVHAIQVGCETCPPRYYTRVDIHLPSGGKRPNLVELINKHLENLTWRRTDMEDWMKKLQESSYMNIRNQNASLKNLEIKVEILINDYQAKAANEKIKTTITHPKIPSSISPLSSERLKETSMLVEMVDVSKKAPVENVLVKIDKFMFPTDFVIIYMLDDPNKTMILGRTFLATIHARINVFRREISLGIGYKNNKIDDTTRAMRYNEWFVENNEHQNYENTSLPYLGDYTIAPGRITNSNNMENLILSIKSYFLNSLRVHCNKHRHRDYSFKEWSKVKVGHTNVNKSVKNAVLNEWILDSFDVESSSSGMSNDPYSRNLEEYKSVFDNEVENLANEYELRIGKKGYSVLVA
nr:hypothetical protein [Tanacetum cinerariifolium]